MGNCWSEETSNPSQANILNRSILNASLLAEEIQGLSHFKTLSNSKLNVFLVGRQLVHMLNGVSFTTNQGSDLAKGLINAIITLQKPDSQEEKEQVEALFNLVNVKRIADGQLFYFGMLDKLNKPISQSSKSRIYHNIANIKKGQTIEIKQKNEWEIESITSNGYSKLSESQLQQVVKYESIADKTRQIGQKLGFKLHSIQKQSQKMTNLLVQCMQKHIQVIDQFKYDLSESQVMKIAQISRQACNYYDNGVYVLLVYLVQSCERLQQKSKTVQQIEVLVKKAIDDISQKYPPGKGLSHQSQGLIKILAQLQKPQNYQQVSFQHQGKNLLSSNKQLQVEEMIEEYAKIAEQSKQLFQELVKNTCIAKCVYFKIGLRYYPNNPNPKAITRIKEKMFFDKESKQSGKKCIGGNIKEVLEEEQNVHRAIIDEILKNTDKVQFKISDMVRGKCVFTQVGDIVQCVNEIKKYAKQNPKFGIKEIESRFTNPQPISDVTLKIVLDNKIEAELQLTLQTNAAIYNFAHKIYQLQRTKVCSKLKITHNYFQEFKDDFSQLAQKALLQAPKSTISSSAVNSISKYLKLGSKYKPFSIILQETIEEKKQQLKQLSVSIDPLLQDLMLVAFDISIGLWGKEIGKVINLTLKNEQLSPKLKSVVLSVFLDKLQLQRESQNMQQLCILERQLDKKIYIEEYVKEYFQIQNWLRYAKQNQRLFCRARQLQQIVLFMEYQSRPIKLRDAAFVENPVIEEHCLQKIKKLKEIFGFYFITRNADNTNYYSFQKYSKWIQDQFDKNSDNGIELLKSEIEIIRSQFQLEDEENPNEVSKRMQQSLQVFKERQQYSKAMQCQILLAECFIKTNKQQTLSRYIDYYNTNVIQKAQTLGYQQKGVIYADSLWRISEYLWNFVKTNQKTKLLQYFTGMAITQMSKCKGKQFIYALKKRWKSYDSLKKPKILPNPNMKYVKVQNLGEQDCQYLQIASWKNINTLNLCNTGSNKIGAKGCQNLSKADWKTITTLYLYNNKIGDVGCQYLIKADWKNITKLNLNNNNIGALGCQHLSKADWKELTTLNLNNNNIGALGCQHLIKANWKNITTLDLVENNIGDVGCQYLRKADWKNITKLDLGNNKIGTKGCQQLRKAVWSNITTLYLYNNNIGDIGCQHLSKADWKELTMLYLWGNNIGAAGCQHLSKANWKLITTLDLDNNNIGAVGCQHLSKADWKELTTLNLWYNKIGMVGCKHLSKANWINLKQLKLYYNQVPCLQREEIKLLFPQKDVKILI